MTPSTSEHPPHGHPDASITTHPTSGPRIASAAAASSTELTHLKVKLRDALRQFPDFPSPGILFEDILPIFADPTLHGALLRALEIQVRAVHGDPLPDVVVGLEARGFLFGPSLALKLGAGFVPVRKKGKLPGPTHSARYQKEYGEDVFEMQQDAIQPGQRVLVVDDIIATGKTSISPFEEHTKTCGSAAAAASLVHSSQGHLIGYFFILELDFLKGREKLQAPVQTLLSGQPEASSNST
ncbi:MAG: hypothetical protein M1823_003912 [Watsoniomyces obsoletus]|nr:MAG: hypothetical protein M1823_003912 [Watsoniomyces obsoletus]